MVELLAQKQWTNQVKINLLIPRSCHAAHAPHVTFNSCLFMFTKMPRIMSHVFKAFLNLQLGSSYRPHHMGHIHSELLEQIESNKRSAVEALTARKTNATSLTPKV